MTYDLLTGARIVFALLDILDEAISEGRKEAITSIVDALSDALSHLRRGLSEDPHFSLGDVRRRSWKDMAPEEILDYMRTAIAIEQAIIDRKQERIPHVRQSSAIRLTGEIKKSAAMLRRMSKEMKSFLLKHWPDFWTDAVEKEFDPWL